MTSRDPTASYYDLTLPDGTRTEVWSVLRAVLTPEEALGYVKACILTRIMRDGRKDVDRLREAEKVGIEAGMLREAMEAYLGSVDAVADRECERFIAELERERDRWRQTAERAEADLDALRTTLETERQAAVATAVELERVRRECDALRDRYRPRRQSEEPAPRDETVLVCGCRGRVWTATRGAHIGETAFWCHQPPAPGEGE